MSQIRSSWDRKINPGINPYAGRPRRIRRYNQRGGTTVPNPGDLLQQAVTNAVVNGKRYAARQLKRAKRYKARQKRQQKKPIITQEGGRVRVGLRKPVNHMPVVYQYHQ
ncbi:Hypothetical predicted protein [Paramuricea clavata]|uniref:Uncharacterized protein n=1 Tax=Paramuricea clavata TaxID=317549 RepID=A0A7D9IJY6_PARCT|nr:Hypothetical predicted protein [Paramuricea clavata]